MVTDLYFQGFSRLTRKQRFEKLLKLGALTQEDLDFLIQGGVNNIDLAEKLIENAIGYFQLPLGVATNFCINGKDYIIPMAVEETSIIAALSKTAKWIKQQGAIKTSIQGQDIIGQIQFAKVKNWTYFEQKFSENKAYLLEKVNQEVLSSMVARGGGATDLELRRLNNAMAVIHLSLNSCDAMGANLMNQALEYLKQPLECITQESISLCILSNLNDKKLTTAEVIINEVEEELGYRLEQASIFAEMDSYRAATHNKGIMNGIDPVAIATGNDWRAVEAGMHAYAAKEGHYQALSKWRYRQGCLIGTLTAPIVVGIVGGVTALHPTARICLDMMNVASANELSQVLAAVGLVQNLGALKALSTEGITKGHMKLHIDNLLLNTDAKEHELPLLKNKLQQWLQIHKRISITQAQQLLLEMRQV